MAGEGGDYTPHVATLALELVATLAGIGDRYMAGGERKEASTVRAGAVTLPHSGERRVVVESPLVPPLSPDCTFP